MTQDEIIEMARFAGIRIDSFGFQGGFIEEFEAFAKLVAAKAFQHGYGKGIAAYAEAVGLEREACANLAKEYAAEYKEGGRFYTMLNGSVTKAAAAACDHIVYTIRARGEQA